MAVSMVLRCLFRRVTGAAASVPPSVSQAAAAAVRWLPAQSRQVQSGPRAIAKILARSEKLPQEFKDYGMYRRRRAAYEQAVATRDKIHNARIFGIGALAVSTLGAIGIYKARARA